MIDEGRRELLAFAIACGGVAAACPALAEAAARASPAAPIDVSALAPDAKFGAMALVAMAKGRVIDMRLRGMASRAFAAPATERTLFHLGSVGKHITAVAILRLAGQGKVDLNAPLSRYVADVSAAWGRATLYQLLTHTGGLPANFEGQDFDRPFTREIVKAFSTGLPPVAAPGQAWVYSNAGYVLLGYVIENVTGESYGAHITERLFRAHGLEDSRADDGEAIIGNRAEPLVWSDGGFRRALQMSSTVSSVAAGGLLMSARDVPTWERALSAGGLLDERSRQIMFTPARFDTGRSTDYGTGWRILSGARRQVLYVHSGSVPGFRAFHLRAPDGDIAMMIMAAGEARMLPLGMEAVENRWPGLTACSLTGIHDRAPQLTAAIRSLVIDGAPLGSTLLAPELARLPIMVAEEQIPRLAAAEAARVRQFILVDDIVTALDRQRRYVIDLGAQRIPLLVCHTPDGLLYRIAM